ncbi:MAG TPA: FeoA family protein [Burkholderiaceae bacterium]|nr:FeoA family protein [Burkholderiaceae bacterium]
MPSPIPLPDLADGARATVVRLLACSPEVDATTLQRLGEIGFIAGEPLQLLRRGPGGREPLAVLIGETMFALRLLEAQCVQVQPA